MIPTIVHTISSYSMKNSCKELTTKFYYIDSSYSKFRGLFAMDCQVAYNWRENMENPYIYTIFTKAPYTRITYIRLSKRYL